MLDFVSGSGTYPLVAMTTTIEPGNGMFQSLLKCHKGTVKSSRLLLGREGFEKKIEGTKWVGRDPNSSRHRSVTATEGIRTLSTELNNLSSRHKGTGSARRGYAPLTDEMEIVAFEIGRDLGGSESCLGGVG